MTLFASIFIFIFGVVLLGFFSAPLWVWVLSISSVMMVFNCALFCYIPLGVVVFFFMIKPLRVKIISSSLFYFLKQRGLLPKISQTEKTALRAGDVWVEGELFLGKPDFKTIFNHPYPSLTKEEKQFIDNEVEMLCAMTSDWEVFQKKDLPLEVWEYLKEKKFLGMIIPKAYDGLGFSAYAHSCVIEKLATHSQVLAITVMVPNSLGPAELLLRYGLKSQKEYYLPRLALGVDIPCFALTEPHAGSDAGSISSSGVLFKENNEIKIRLNFNKRYITLSSIASLIGLAFILKDPDGLLGEKEGLGITCALVDASKEGIDQTKRHDPLGVPFINAPLIGEDVIIGLDDIIGGKEGIGKGWMMLMESLAIGRGISLPSTSTGGSKLATFVASTYAVSRYQFGLSIAKFEGIAEVLGRLGASTYMLDAAKTFTLGAINQGKKPAVTNAIMKYHSTEIFRKNIIDAMDIQGGAGISKGPKNLLAHAYIGAPIAITVEGANIMTRSLIMFGQGLIRCHPYAYKEIEALEQGDIAQFDSHLFAHISYVVRNFSRAFMMGLTRGYLHRATLKNEAKRYEQKLAWASAKFSFLSDVALGLLGANLKKRETLSGRFGDILAQMFLITATLKRYEVQGYNTRHTLFVTTAIDKAFLEIDRAFIGILNNMVSHKLLSIPFKTLALFSYLNPMGVTEKDKNMHKIAMQLTQEDSTREEVCGNLYQGVRIKQLLGSLNALQTHKHLLLKEKQNQPLNVEEKEILKKVHALQEEVVFVDAFRHHDYFKAL